MLIDQHKICKLPLQYCQSPQSSDFLSLENQCDHTCIGLDRNGKIVEPSINSTARHFYLLETTSLTAYFLCFSQSLYFHPLEELLVLSQVYR